MNRKEVILAVKKELEKSITQLEHSVKRYKTASDMDEDNTLDPEDYSHQGEAKDMQLRFETRLYETRQQYTKLLNFMEQPHIDVEPGALIETDQGYFFIGLALPSFIADGKEVICVSEKAPLYQDLKNCKSGDVVSVGQKSYTIISVG